MTLESYNLSKLRIIDATMRMQIHYIERFDNPIKRNIEIAIANWR